MKMLTDVFVASFKPLQVYERIYGPEEKEADRSMEQNTSKGNKKVARKQTKKGRGKKR
jgi:hypothetical protein